MDDITDGFWELIGKQGTAIWSGNRIVANMTEARTNHKRARREAKLIAAAPLMYATLRDLDNMGGLGMEVHRAIQHALKKAGSP